MNTMIVHHSHWFIGGCHCFSHRLKNLRRDARLRGSEHELSLDILAFAVGWWGCRCAYCLSDLLDAVNHPCQLTFDHVLPISQGGDTTVFNLLPACRSCNGLRGGLPLDFWLHLEFGFPALARVSVQARYYFSDVAGFSSILHS